MIVDPVLASKFRRYAIRSVASICGSLNLLNRSLDKLLNTTD